MEGFVSCKDLDGKYSFDPVTLRLIHNKNGRIFQLEQPVTVSFSGVDEERRQINFKLVEAQEIPTGTGSDDRLKNHTGRRIVSVQGHIPLMEVCHAHQP